MAHDADAGAPTPAHLRECHDCGLVQVLPSMPPGARATCPRCDAVLRQTRRDPFNLPLALNLTALVLLAVGSTLRIMTVSSSGQQHDANLLSGPLGFESYGMWAVALVVAITTIGIPVLRLGCMVAVLLAIRLPAPPPITRSVFAFAEYLRPWSMVEIYLLGAFVAYVKLGDLVYVETGIALYALGALTVTMVAADVMLDPQAVWDRLDAIPGLAPDRARSAGTMGMPTWRMGCHTCGLVTRGRDGSSCPRCGFTLRHRRPRAITRAWALSIASLLLYIPANTYPVLTVVRLGNGTPSTILGGVHELLMAGMWPLALLVFVASVAVPIVKIAALAVLLITTQMRTAWRVKERTRMYRAVEFVGRWSMIDIFMVSLLVGLVQLGSISVVRPGAGATAFAAVVIMTMFAATCFDPRLMWDAAEEREA